MQYIVGNWKMHGTRAEAKTLAEAVLMHAKDARQHHVALCPPATLVREVGAILEGSSISLGGQDCHSDASGAHTGDISAPMLADAGCSIVIVGHSERRADYGESNALVCLKARAALDAGLVPVICVGESASDRAIGKTSEVVLRQVHESLPEGVRDPVMIAYEPIWAIGTGEVPTMAEIDAVHSDIRNYLIRERGLEPEWVYVLYGGSVKPSNAKDILALETVGGVLVGGASLIAEDFCAIVAAARA